LASVSVSSLLTGQILQTGLLEVNAASTVPGSDSVSADATVDDLEILIVELLQLLTISADTVQSTADISGTCGDVLTATGTTTIENATVGGTLGAGLSISVNPAPNTVLLNLSGITVILNEQIIGGDGVNSRSLTVNAIRISLDNVLLTAIGTLSGDIIISQSQAQLLCDEQTSAEANLSIIKSDSPDPVTVGDTLTYTLTITNNGPDSATNVVVTDTLPNSVTFVSAMASPGSCSESGGIVTCNLGNLAVGQAIVTITVIPNSVGTIFDTATVTSDTDDPDPSNNTDTEETLVDPIIFPTPTPTPFPTPIPGPITVPTLSEWGIIITTVLLGLFGVMSLWRRRAL
jgi:uncharacterized repeat protein (TIGR01451 family)